MTFTFIVLLPLLEPKIAMFKRSGKNESSFVPDDRVKEFGLSSFSVMLAIGILEMPLYHIEEVIIF